MQPEKFQQSVLRWFDQYGRTHLPWQQNVAAYPVWISEIMLQQTQVTTVIPYFKRFMASFPTVQDLAAASTDEVLHHWTGLGYYARARNLHKTAQHVSQELGGKFPTEVEALCKLSGIGRSTAGAISAIAFNQKAAILDGNVKRVLARFSAIDGWPGKADVADKLWTIAEIYTPKERVANYTQAMMDLGATLCTRTTPECTRCPLVQECKAYHQGNTLEYPGKKPKKVLPTKKTYFLMIKNPQGELLLEQNPPAGLWGGLWVFPRCSHLDDIPTVCKSLGVTLQHQSVLSRKRHTFSHFHLDYQVVEINTSFDGNQVSCVEDRQNQLWYNLQSPLSLGMPAPIKVLIERALTIK
jgi:A/G-specific adenine glycosylase